MTNRMLKFASDICGGLTQVENPLSLSQIIHYEGKAFWKDAY